MKKHKSKLVNSSGFDTAQLPMRKVKEIKHLFMTGQISYDEAMGMAREPVREINQGMAKLAKRFGCRAQKIGIGRLFR